MIYLILIIMILGLVCFFSIKGNINKTKDNKELRTTIDILEDDAIKKTKIENEKTEIRNKYNEKENDVDNSNNVDNSVLQNTSREHNHKFREACGKNCPAFNRE